MTASEEYFDVVDEQDVIISQRLRRDVHRLGLRHRAIHVLLFNSRGELFLQQRSWAKDCSPGLWDSSASGHLSPGEDYDDCAVRELKEELGIDLDSPPIRILRLSACAETGQEFCWVYRAVAEGPFVLQASEVRGGGWFLPQAIDEWVARRPMDFAGAFLLIWRKVARAASSSEFNSNQIPLD